jgi:diguanylate cyclase (GGDEF)-like protein
MTAVSWPVRRNSRSADRGHARIPDTDTGDAPAWATPEPQHAPTATDAFVFRRAGDRLKLVGGYGRAAGWTGIVDVLVADESIAAGVIGRSNPAHIRAEQPVRVVGPYWARNAALVPVGADYVVVFGADEPFNTPDASLVLEAASLVGGLDSISPLKLIADELEVVHAVRKLLAYRPEALASTARHIALTAAEALSCELGCVFIAHDGQEMVEIATREWTGVIDPVASRAGLRRIYERALRGAILDAELGADMEPPGAAQGLVTRYAVPVGGPSPFGLLLVAHAQTRPRGFTNLCQRIGQTLAESAESLLLQALEREGLAAERDRFLLEARTDLLTGLANRHAWDEAVRTESARRARNGRRASIVSADLDGLKETNDTYGHKAGDELLRATADLLRGHSRATDFIARLGGDEFMLLLPETDAENAGRLVRRLRHAARRVTAERGRRGLDISLGVATAEPDEPLEAAIRRADAAMYRCKARRAAHARRLRPEVGQ